MVLYFDSNNPAHMSDPLSKRAVKAYQMRTNSEKVILHNPTNAIPRPAYRRYIYINKNVSPIRYDLQEFKISGMGERCYEITKNEARHLFLKYNKL